ncbi:ketoacyl-ACP synthase III [Georgenia sp. 311]|uniref:Beta-ketoacyl-[acyl-carrier-protein] synthase III n=1 Tax=Georgenia wutianyii TaxID=2585135 RepID=A0ABX5VKI9_9MICO|nr:MULTISPECIES: beta-ketoacyl-ACP synthase III [Georgenia]QDB78961.1 ketoacyl-ACP synthase III [Georgenia wutianyii]TNC17212.1 ketoacyl-ACP synthase III [Georgenia sp. 311]
MTRPTLRSPQRHAYSRILGISGVRGERVVSNDDIAGPIDSSDEWIRQRTGIIERRRATEEQTIAAMTEEAARKALEASGVEASRIGAVILATVTHLEQTPALATIIADRIGASPAAAYDISAACAGYCYGIAQADALVRAGTADHVLVIGAERMSDFIDPTDRTISFLLGDGAGAAVVGPSDTPGIGPTVWGSDGSQADTIYQTHSWLTFRDGTDTSWPTLRQKGPTVFKWASFEMAKVATAAIEAAGLRPEDIEVFLPHQANMRIIDQLAKQVGLSDSVVIARDIAETGNTSAASIPLAAERLIREGAVESGALALQIGFGAGLAYAAQVVALP